MGLEVTALGLGLGLGFEQRINASEYAEVACTELHHVAVDIGFIQVDPPDFLPSGLGSADVRLARVRDSRSD